MQLRRYVTRERRLEQLRRLEWERQERRQAIAQGMDAPLGTRWVWPAGYCLPQLEWTFPEVSVGNWPGR